MVIQVLNSKLRMTLRVSVTSATILTAKRNNKLIWKIWEAYDVIQKWNWLVGTAQFFRGKEYGAWFK